MMAMLLLAVVREQYLRNDIPCGSISCNACQHLYGLLSQGQLTLPGAQDDDTGARRRAKKSFAPILGSQGRQFDVKGKGHYLVIDTNVALHQVSGSVPEALKEANSPLADGLA